MYDKRISIFLRPHKNDKNFMKIDNEWKYIMENE